MMTMQLEPLQHKSRILAKAVMPKVKFDPKNKKHIASLKKFLSSGNWGDTRFVAELPHVEVPMTCLVKLANHVLAKVEAK